MKTEDLNTKITSSTLNENMYKKFGVRINFENYSREQLENYRNLLRTKINQTESNSNFNELLSNETYQKDKYVIGVLNQRIKEMLGEGAKVDRQAAHITKSMMKKGKSKKDAEAIAWAHIKHPKKKKNAEESMSEGPADEPVTPDPDADDKRWDDMDEAFFRSSRGSRADVYRQKGPPAISPDTDKDDRGGKITVPQKDREEIARILGKKDTKETTMRTTEGKKAKPDFLDLDKDGNKAEPMKKAAKDSKVKEELKGGQTKLDANHNGKLDSDDFKKLRAKKKKVKENHRMNVRIVNEAVLRYLAEDEEGKAKAITAGGDMVNDFTSWMTRVGQYQTKSMIELADNIRANFGQAASEQFKQSVAPALEQALNTLQQTREAISHAVAVLAGEESGEEQMGASELDSTEFGGEEIDSSTDDLNAGADEFGASDAAAGGPETAGRLRREGRETFANKLNEGHMLMRSLSK